MAVAHAAGILVGTHVTIDGKVQRYALCAGGHLLRAWVDRYSRQFAMALRGFPVMVPSNLNSPQ